MSWCPLELGRVLAAFCCLPFYKFSRALNEEKWLVDVMHIHVRKVQGLYPLTLAALLIYSNMTGHMPELVSTVIMAICQLWEGEGGGERIWENEDTSQTGGPCHKASASCHDITDEAGASIYSVSPEAVKEMPNMDPNLRSAVPRPKSLVTVNSLTCQSNSAPTQPDLYMPFQSTLSP
ncbi:S1 RNA-binding domain-containing protein 1 [Anabarilius grahami]|uniref:S1 RNA-binding domain-containing protein 1 n=1 Tax=Anabarilius grahami TaxID=495550 RepID=A0A3N0XX24_ANAGA|nr:S1 RNA-binding domain-containing protein 1 [Anabarilius grahami]